ncbi:alpha/beta fold hydrolase [Methanocalculus taiwanensis]|uniref:Alpha/beta fold hydrolase n=1 Tax=Methanocalculus taiwanensis TaxID=106207 RepID=A0ABD4TK04_9EURY|nr:alpha/beta hydrolase [Methanocalculus taiwanensis]MCQ1538113.1 alpha/beta fold hydrolase [Methanocalculus taiwanensis]
MKIQTITAVTLVLALCLLFTCGCTTTTETKQLPAVTAPTAISYNDIPVQYAEVNGITIGYREFGVQNTEPLLMLVGFGETMNTWNATFINILAEDFHVYTYDHRGMGESTDVDAQYTIAQLGDDAAGLIIALGYDSMNIYGVSMGSTVSQQLLIDHPEKVRKAILSSATYSASIPETSLLHQLLEANAGDMSKPDGVRKEAVANLAWEGSYANLSEITNHVMLITGTADILTPPAVAIEMAGQIDGSWLIRFKDIPHVGSRYAPLEYGTITTTFLKLDESPEYSIRDILNSTKNAE